MFEKIKQRAIPLPFLHPLRGRFLTVGHNASHLYNRKAVNVQSVLHNQAPYKHPEFVKRPCNHRYKYNVS